MNNKQLGLVSLLLVVLSTPLQAMLPVQVDGQRLPSLAPMLEKATPAVVNIATRSVVRSRQNSLFNDPLFRHFFDLPEKPQERESKSLGSGVVVDAAKGYVLTNNHVIDGADEITVTLRDGRELQAKVVGVDPQADIAVIRIPAQDLTELAWADSGQLRVGDFVVAIGNPFGLGQTVTSGIVSALGRSGLGIEDYEDFIQTDASINPGNSGGALVNLRGELVGINTAILGPNGGNIGIGFAIPANMARQIMDQLVEYGEVRRGRLGINAQDLTPELATAFNLNSRHGVVISQVDVDSPAARAGLRPGDVVLAVDGKPVRGALSMRNVVGLLRIGQEVELKIVRNGRELTLTVMVADEKRTSRDGGVISERLEGAQLANFSQQDGNQKLEGVMITDVAQGSAAAYYGLRKGDLILSANRREVANLEQLETAVGRSKNLLLNIRRGRQALFLLLQ